MDGDYYWALAAAFVRGRLGDGFEPRPQSDEAWVALGREQGLRLHKFKHTSLPRVLKVLGVLAGLAPDSLLDIGSGRGAFLWPLLHRFDGLPVTALDHSPRRINDLQAVAEGGVTRLTTRLEDVTQMDLEPDAYDVATALEVLEHLREPGRAARCILRGVRRFVVVSVPSKPDNNPDHIQFFSPENMRGIWMDAGASKVTIDYVPNHMIAVVKK